MFHTLASQKLAAACLVALSLMGVRAAPAAEPFTGEMEIMLQPSPKGERGKPTESGPRTLLYLEARAGKWQRPFAKGLGIFEHTGLVDSAVVSDTGMQLKLRLAVNGDFWIPGRWIGAYTIDMAPVRTGRSRERTRGASANRRSPAWSRAHSAPAPVREGFVPPAVDEHPRVLFRKSDIPRLQAKLKTPLGQAYLARAKVGDVINLGVLYQLTGDASYAQRRVQSIQARYKDKKDGKIPVHGFGSGGFGHQIFTAALAYDLCQDAWPENFRTWLRVQFEEFTEHQQKVLMTSHANFHPCSNYYGPGRGVPGVVSMAQWGEKGSPPLKPRDPVAQRAGARAPGGLSPGQGRAGARPGPRQGARQVDLGRSAAAEGPGGQRAALARDNVEVGSEISIAIIADGKLRSRKWAFRPLPADMFSGDGLDIGKLAGSGGATNLVYCVLKVDEAQVVGVAKGHSDGRSGLDGLKMREDQIYRLSAGLHPMLAITATSKSAGTWRPA